MVTKTHVAVAGIGGTVAGLLVGRAIAPTKFREISPLPEAETIAANITITHTFDTLKNYTTRLCVHTATAPIKRTTYLMLVGTDVEAIMDLAYAQYPEGWFWTVEVSRVGWGKIEITGYGKTFIMDQAYGDEVIHPGYVSFRIPAI